MKLAVFSGTSEGHALCRFLSARGARADVYVATEYGAAVMEPQQLGQGVPHLQPGHHRVHKAVFFLELRPLGAPRGYRGV